jgi:ribosome-associated protein
MPVEIAPDLEVPDAEIEIRYIRSPGPGGQNVNKLSTAVQLFFDAAHSTLLDAPSRQRLAALAGRRLTRDGVLVLAAHRHRTQEGNRRDAFARLAELIIAARVAPRVRRATKPSRGAKERRITAKKQRQGIKRLRSRPSASD